MRRDFKPNDIVMSLRKHTIVRLYTRGGDTDDDDRRERQEGA